MRIVDGDSEVLLAAYEHFADRDQLRAVVLARMLTGVSTRWYQRGLEPVGEGLESGARSTSKSAVSRMFVDRTAAAGADESPDLRLAVVMLDGIELHGRTNIVALGITTDGDKLAHGLWDGSTENHRRRAHPGAAVSLREAVEETPTVTRLRISGKLKLTLRRPLRASR